MGNAFDCLLVNGKIENIHDGNDFARMLGEKLGDDAERYFRENWLIYDDCSPEDLPDSCPGECDHTYEIQEHYQNVLHDVKDKVAALMNARTDYKRELAADLIYNLINSEL